MDIKPLIHVLMMIVDSSGQSHKSNLEVELYYNLSLRTSKHHLSICLI